MFYYDGSLDSDVAGERISYLGNRIAICMRFMCNHESNEDIYPALGFHETFHYFYAESLPKCCSMKIVDFVSGHPSS